MKIEEVTTTQITFTESELLDYTKAMWNQGFNEAVKQFTLQAKDPQHPITRTMTIQEQQYWKHFVPIGE